MPPKQKALEKAQQVAEAQDRKAKEAEEARLAAEWSDGETPRIIVLCYITIPPSSLLSCATFYNIYIVYIMLCYIMLQCFF